MVTDSIPTLHCTPHEKRPPMPRGSTTSTVDSFPSRLQRLSSLLLQKLSNTPNFYGGCSPITPSLPLSTKIMNPAGEAVLAATASFFIITFIVAIAAFLCGRLKSRHHHHRLRHQTRTVPNTELTSITTDESASFDPNLKRISMEELNNATRGFSADYIVGDGSFGLVYKAKLSSGVTVAIKKLDPDAFQGFREFQVEMETLGKLRHQNIVKILGYCVSGIDRVLILEFIEKGSLDQWIHDTSWSGSEQSARFPMSLETRVKVVRGVANGLSYLHGLDTPIIHRDIKASNVLLDSNFEAHIADFGLARRIDASHTHVSTQMAGTMGYMPPEYKDGVTAATPKADVYSFGILMFEVATGERPNLPMKLEKKEVGWIEWARKMVEKNAHMEMLDQKIPREGLREEEVKEYFRIACFCTDEIMKVRPVMTQVVELLSRISETE